MYTAFKSARLFFRSIAMYMMVAVLSACNSGTSNNSTSQLPTGPELVTGTESSLSIVTHFPIRDEANADVGNALSITFNKSLNASSINTASFYLVNVPGTVQYDSKAFKLSFIPSQALAKGTTYTVVVTKNIRDENGTSLPEEYTWSFTTAAASGLPNIIPTISPIPNSRILQGNTYTITPILLQGNDVRWTKAYGQDDMTVDAATGKVTWHIPADFPGESFHLGVKASNMLGSHTETWVLTVGVGDIIYVGPTETHTTLKAGMAAMKGGDTLIMRDGTYFSTKTNQANSIPGPAYKGQQPPSGTATGYTTVMADNPGRVILDAQGNNDVAISILGIYHQPDFAMNSTATVPREYIALKGIIAKNALSSGIRLDYTHHMKLIDMGVVDSAGGALTPLTSSAANVYILRSSHILIEGLYSWGHSRYKLQFKDSINSIVRRSIARLDGYRGPEPVGGFESYCSKNILYQNNIIIDGNHSEFWTNFSNHQSLFGVPATGCTNYSEGNVFVRNIGLNSHTGLMQTDADANPNPTIWRDMVGWDLKMDRYAAGTAGHTSVLRGTGATLSDQITMGRITADPGYDPFPGGGRGFFYSRSNNSFVNNSIIYQFGWNGSMVINQGPLMWASSNRFDFDYNNIYEFVGTLIGGSVGTITNTITLNPLNNGLMYLPRIENGSPLQTAGKNGVRVGANVMTFIGKSGTFYGDPGYDQETHLSMWPFPHEDLFKEKFQNYSYTDVTRDGSIKTLSGNRGFASSTAKQLNGVDDVTLTSYIWEYLGNPIPDEIYRNP